MAVTAKERMELMVECTMIAKDFIEASHAVHNSQYSAFAVQLDQIGEKFEKLRGCVKRVDDSGEGDGQML